MPDLPDLDVTIPFKRPQTPVMTGEGSANPDAPVPLVFGQEIARGGMGSILQAQDCRLPRTVAVKIILSEMRVDEAQKQRFINEAAVLAKLAHPNIVPVYDIGRDGSGQLYYTMKLVKGRTLQDILKGLRHEEADTIKTYTLAHLLTIFRKVCDAMAFAHSRGIIHRDLKPENIMVGEFGEVLVMDWGLAKLLDGSADTSVRSAASPESGEESPRSLSSTLDGSIMGTPQYMSPEQAEGRVADMDARSDIFSLGGILYAILTLRPPIEGKTLDEVLNKVISGSIAPLSVAGQTRRLPSKEKPAGGAPALQKPVPPALAAVTMKALTVDKAQRYQDVAAFSADIEAYQNGFATSAENAGSWKQFTLLIKRHKAAAIGIAAVLIVGGVLGTQAIIEGRRARRGEAAAKATLADLRRTAPVFYAQAKVDFEEGNFDAAIEKIGYAIQLDDTAADYHLFLANLRESSQDLAAAAEGYHRVLDLRNDAVAQANLALCDKLLRETKGAPLTRAQQTQLLSSLRKETRLLEAAPLAALIDPDIAVAKAALLSRLREARKQPGWRDSRVSPLSDGTFKIDLHSLPLIDFSVLKGQPVTALNIDNLRGADLGGLAGLPLKELSLRHSEAVDLSPLQGMPLVSLDLSFMALKDLSQLSGMKLQWLSMNFISELGDLSPLAGMPLVYFDCQHCGKVYDLSPLRGAPLVDLNVAQTAVSSLAPLAGAPLKRLQLWSTKVTDITSLSQFTTLEQLDLHGLPVSDLTPVAHLHLTILDCASSKITSIAPLRGQPLRKLILSNTGVTDLSPLKDCTTLEVIALPAAAGDLSVLRKLPKLRLISTRSSGSGLSIHPTQTAREFWKEYDAQQAAGKK